MELEANINQIEFSQDNLFTIDLISRTLLTSCIRSQGGHSIVKNMGGWLDSFGSGILVGKR